MQKTTKKIYVITTKSEPPKVFQTLDQASEYYITISGTQKPRLIQTSIKKAGQNLLSLSINEIK